MKIKSYDYKGRAEDSIAGFAVEFYKIFWDSLPIEARLKLQNSYHEVNRALGETIKKRVQILGAKYQVSLEMTKQFGEEKADQEALYKLGKILADELLKSEQIAVSKGKDWRLPVTEYEVSIPFIIVNEGTFQ